MSHGDWIGIGVLILFIYLFSKSTQAGVKGLSYFGLGLIGVCLGWAVAAFLDLHKLTYGISIPIFYSIFMLLGVAAGILVSRYTKISFQIKDDFITTNKRDWKGILTFVYCFLTLLIAGIPLLYELFMWQPVDPEVLKFELYMTPLITLAILGLVWNSKRKKI